MSESLRGQFLIASCRLRDPNFFKTVVLIVEHNDECAMGLVVNRPSSVTVSNAMSGNFDLPETGELIHCGGPVEAGTYFVLHNTQDAADPEGPVCGELFVGNSPAAFEEIVRQVLDDSGMRFRVYSGCAGWGAGQLEGEVARGDWFCVPASEEMVFHEDPYVVWDTLMRQVYEAKRLVPHFSQNPELN